MNARKWLAGRRLLHCRCGKAARWIVHFAYREARVHELMCDVHAQAARRIDGYIGMEGI